MRAMFCSGLDIQKYWDTLHAAGIDQQRLASFDRSITQEPSFSQQQVPQLVKDLQAYLVTLCAVHGGLDLQSGALPVLGYSQVRCFFALHDPACCTWTDCNDNWLQLPLVLGAAYKLHT